MAENGRRRMDEARRKPAYLIFDVEAVGDGDLIARVKYRGENLAAAGSRPPFRPQLMAEKGKDILPTTFTLPIALAIAKIDASYRLMDLSVLDPPPYRPPENTHR